ncbi:MAG TPA: hypothetical protein DEB31_06235, partial [Clostridiales bacterium]|nr:hypothetical protein [Clostridiales bacterium]
MDIMAPPDSSRYTQKIFPAENPQRDAPREPLKFRRQRSDAPLGDLVPRRVGPTEQTDSAEGLTRR